MSVNYQRNRVDASKVVVKSLPAAAANHNTDPIDLEQEFGGLLENIAFEIKIPALPALVEAKTLTVQVMDSADGLSFAPVDPNIRKVITGGVGNGAAAWKGRFRLPPGARRYVALNLAVETGGGNNTGVSATLGMLF